MLTHSFWQHITTALLNYICSMHNSKLQDVSSPYCY